MYARCHANIALPPSPALAQALPHSPLCLPHRLCELQTWLLDEDACLTEGQVLLDLRAQQQAA